MKKVEIIPAILPKDFAELSDKVAMISGFTKFVQVDICDGQFVPNATWPYKKPDDTFKKILNEEEGLPNWQTLNYEFDLMVNEPEEVVHDWLQVGASRIIIHVEAKGDMSAVIEELDGLVESGLAINIETPITVIETFKDKVQFVQCMGIDNIGFQQQAFDAKVIEKVKEVRAAYPNMVISVDGGVTLENSPILIGAGVNRLVVGSAIFNDENPLDAIQRFKKL